VSVIAAPGTQTAFIRISLAQDICIQPGIEFENEDSFPRVVNYILGCIIEHMYDEEAQKPVRVMLCHLGEEAAKKIIDRMDTPGSDDTAKDLFELHWKSFNILPPCLVLQRQ
jgi:hypothetical protein